MSTSTHTSFDGYSTDALCTFIEDVAPVLANLDGYDTARGEMQAEYDAAVAELKSRYARPVTDGGERTLTELLDERVGDADHALRHVTDDDTTFKGRHSRHVETTVENDTIVHNIIESYDRDAHSASLSWSQSPHRETCPSCGADLTYEKAVDDADQYVETSTCSECAFSVRCASVHAPVDSEEYMRPLFYRATIPHDFDDETDVDWDDLTDNLDDYDDNIESTANIYRALSLQKHLNRIRDKSYSSEDGVQTTECERCGDTVDDAAITTHAHFGDVCPDCADATVWSVDDANLPDDVVERMNDHASFSTDSIVTLLRDVLYYSNYIRTNRDDADADDVPAGITTGAGGKRDAHGMGRGTKGTGLRRPNGAFHGKAHWRTVLADAVDTGLIERADDLDVDNEDERARWTATEKGRAVFDELARCKTCGETKQPFKHVSTYQTQGKYTNQSTRLTLACADCEKMSSSPSGGMVISSSTGQSAKKKLDGVAYDD